MKTAAYKWIYNHVTPVRANAAIAGAFILYLLMTREDMRIGDFISFDLISGISITAIIAIAVTGIIKYCEVKIEDAMKLEEDCDKLIEMYSSERGRLLRVRGRGQTIVIPILPLIWDKQGIKIKIEDDREAWYRLPGLAEQNFVKLFNAHKHSNVFNGKMLRAQQAQCVGSQLTLRTMRTTYFDSLVTNRSSDTQIIKGVSIRSLYEPGPGLTPLQGSKLSNHMGINGMVCTSEGQLIFTKRLKNLSISKGRMSCSCAAAIKSKYALDENGIFTVEGLTHAIQMEMKDELFLDPGEYIWDVNKNIVGFVRGLVEAGKPEFCFYVKAKLTAEQIRKKFEEARLKDKENKNLKRDADRLIFATRGEVEIITARDIIIKGKVYKTTPITLAAIDAMPEDVLMERMEH